MNGLGILHLAWAILLESMVSRRGHLHVCAFLRCACNKQDRLRFGVFRYYIMLLVVMVAVAVVRGSDREL